MELGRTTTGGAAVAFSEREFRRLGVEASVANSDCFDLAQDIWARIEAFDNRPIHAWQGWNRYESLMWDAADLTRIEHRNCGFDKSGQDVCWVPRLVDCQDDPESPEDALLRALGYRFGILADFVTSYVTMYPTDDMTEFHAEAVATGLIADNAARKAALIDDVNEALRTAGFVVTGNGMVLPVTAKGTGPALERPVLDALDRHGWRDVSDKIAEAQDEIAKGKYADAVTDAGAALQTAYERAGFVGKTLKEQHTTAHKAGLYSGTETKLGVTAEGLGEWISAIRNIKSDAHHGAVADERDAELALRTVLALCAWLADRP